jgi:hypothetical protein
MGRYNNKNENLMDKPQENKAFRNFLLVTVAIIALVLSFIQIHSIWKIELNSNPNESIFLVAEKTIIPIPA